MSLEVWWVCFSVWLEPSKKWAFHEIESISWLALDEEVFDASFAREHHVIIRVEKSLREIWNSAQECLDCVCIECWKKLSWNEILVKHNIDFILVHPLWDLAWWLDKKVDLPNPWCISLYCSEIILEKSVLSESVLHLLLVIKLVQVLLMWWHLVDSLAQSLLPLWISVVNIWNDYVHTLVFKWLWLWLVFDHLLFKLELEKTSVHEPEVLVIEWELELRS